MNHTLRCESVRHCRWVDEVLEDAPWVLSDGYLTAHSIDFVAHDAIPYKDTSGSASNSGDVYAHIKAKGMFLETQRTEGLSTSDIIVSIIRGYDEYVIRNLDRGYSKEELNVGASWQVRARFHEKQREFKQSLERLKGEQKRAEDAAIAFIREFNPKVGTAQRAHALAAHTHCGRCAPPMRALTCVRAAFPCAAVSCVQYLMRRPRSSNSISDMTDEPSNAPRSPMPGDPDDGLVQFTPRHYYSRLKETLPERSAGLWHHSVGLAWAVLETGGYMLSYLNPLSYLQSHKKQH